MGSGCVQQNKEITPTSNRQYRAKSWLNLLGIILQDDPWDMQVDNLLSKAASRMYILIVCRLYGYTKENLHILFGTVAHKCHHKLFS